MSGACTKRARQHPRGKRKCYFFIVFFRRKNIPKYLQFLYVEEQRSKDEKESKQVNQIRVIRDGYSNPPTICGALAPSLVS